MTDINAYKGIAIINSADEFIFSGDKKSGIESVKELIDRGYEISLYDNRDNRDGMLSIRKREGKYQIKSGGHGFYVDWKPTDVKQVLWIIKVLYIFNLGKEKENHGIATKNS